MVSVAVIGLGWWGKTIGRLLAASRNLKLVRAVDVDPKGAEWASAQGLPFSTNYGDALADPKVDAVILCTPHAQHRSQILDAVAARKHIFCEKPLALTRSDAIECVQACRTAKLVLGIGHERRFEPPILELRRLYDSGEIGMALQIEANFSQDKFLNLPADNWRLSAKDAPAGPMTATGIHLLDLAVSILGPARRVVCNVSQLGSQLSNGDTLATLVGFANGTNALISAMLATPFVGRFALYANKGWVEVVDKAHPESSEGWVLTKCLRGGRPERKDYPAAPAVLTNLDAFGDAVAGRAPYPVSDAELVGTIAALEAVFTSARKGGTVETVVN
ncbi:MAG: Gfo/Idh/MocA family oxidoreductase [Alphaproteobacteria bacterium]|nr:Gfo/Idh/MocA family oxidoreductase [Alphaproteobacteria bacterium]